MNIKRIKIAILITVILISGTFLACDNQVEANKEDASLLTASMQATAESTPNFSEPRTNPSTDPSQIITDRFYPIMLCNGWAGTDFILANLVEFMYRIKTTLENAGREVYYAPVPCFSVSSVRSQKIADKMYEVMVGKVIEKAKLIKGGGIVTEADKLKVDISDLKFNLLCHSHGGINARYLARLLTIPDPRYDEPVNAPKWPAAYFISSITMLSTPNTGTYIAEWIADGADWPIPQIAQVLGKLYELVNLDDPQLSDLRGAAREMSESNMKMNMNPMLFKGQDCSHIKVYHMAAYVDSGHIGSHFFSKINNPFIAVMNSINENDPTEDRRLNDGVVCTKSAQWSPGTEDYENALEAGNGMQWNYLGTLENVDHFQLINQILENLFFGWPDWDARQFYTDHSDFLAENGF